MIQAVIVVDRLTCAKGRPAARAAAWPARRGPELDGISAPSGMLIATVRKVKKAADAR